MKKAYLKDGQEVRLIETLGEKRFLVEGLVTFYHWEGEEETDWSGEERIVSEIFEKPPIEKVNEEYLSTLDKIQNKNEELKNITIELHQSKNEIRKMQEEKEGINKLVIDRSRLLTAKRITMFTKDGIIPIDMNEKSKKDLKISIELRVMNGEERRWGAKVYPDNCYDSGNYIDPEYDFMYDLSDEEILEAAKDRASKKPIDYFSKYRLINADNKYLTSELTQIKNDYILSEEKKQKEKLSSEIEAAKNKLAELKKKSKK